MIIRNLKLFGMVVAALALSGIAASAAQAQQGVLTTGLTPGTHTAALLHGTQEGEENYFEAFGQKVECENENVHFTTQATGTDKELTATAEYNHCVQGARPVTVNMTSCDYFFQQPETDEAGLMTGLVNLECDEGDFIDVTVYTEGTPTNHSANVYCNIRVFPKKNMTHVLYTDGGVTEAGYDDVTLDVNVSNVHATAKGAGCSFGLDVTTEAAHYVSKVTLTGEEDDVWMSEE